MSKKANQPAPEIASSTLDEHLTFEAAYRELETIVTQLERGELTLEQALELHERGQQLIAYCIAQLDQAELKVRKLEINNP